VVQLDHLGGGEVPGRLLGEPHHQDGADGEVRHDQDAYARVPGQPAAHLVEALLAEARRADHRIQIVLDAPAQVPHHRARVGKVDHHVAAGQSIERIALVDLGDDLQIRRLGDRSDHLAAHPSPRSQHPDLGHSCLLPRAPVS